MIFKYATPTTFGDIGICDTSSQSGQEPYSAFAKEYHVRITLDLIEESGEPDSTFRDQRVLHSTFNFSLCGGMS